MGPFETSVSGTVVEGQSMELANTWLIGEIGMPSTKMGAQKEV